jgi:hypothetical protein
MNLRIILLDLSEFFFFFGVVLVELSGRHADISLYLNETKYLMYIFVWHISLRQDLISSYAF